MIGRREFMRLLGGAAAVPLVARAQQQPMPVIGLLCGGASDSPEDLYRLNAFRRGLRDAGYVEGQNIAFEYRWAQLQYDRLPAFAADLIHREVALIVAMGGIPSAVAAKPATVTIPILFAIGADPVKLGLVSSLNRPGGNVTGVSFLINTLGAKQLEMLHEAIANTDPIGFLRNPANPNAETDLRNVLTAGEALGRKLVVLPASSDTELDAAFARLAREEVGAIVVGADFFLVSRRDRLIALAARQGIPAIYPLREFAAAGGLMSYGPSLADGYHLVGLYAARILKGEKPADLPVQQSTKVEFVINLKTAKTLALAFPLTLLGRADEVIE
jgi:putative tryptophan/tyrosine transport system substrate-binding protein